MPKQIVDLDVLGANPRDPPRSLLLCVFRTTAGSSGLDFAQSGFMLSGINHIERDPFIERMQRVILSIVRQGPVLRMHAYLSAAT